MSKHVFFTGAAVGALVIGLAGSAVAAKRADGLRPDPGSAYNSNATTGTSRWSPGGLHPGACL